MQRREASVGLCRPTSNLVIHPGTHVLFTEIRMPWVLFAYFPYSQQVWGIRIHSRFLTRPGRKKMDLRLW